MREELPRELCELLGRLDLATPERVGRVRRRAVRLARHLPLFESVWVDALVQARLLSPFQAAEINAGRGAELGIGPYVLASPLASLGYARCYRARRRGSRRWVRLAIADRPSRDAATRLEQCIALAARHQQFDLSTLAPIEEGGLDGDRIWTVSRHVDGRTAADWMTSNGRFPAEVVLEIARQMLVGLVALENARVCHGDISARGAVLTDQGEVVLPQPGLRGILRPEEGYAYADLIPEAYDYLAPERIDSGSVPSTASDIYACGCLWWHLLAGRPPLPGGDSLAKLRSAQTADIPPIERILPDAPPALARAISAATQREPSLRPESMARLATLLGPPAGNGRRLLASCLGRRGEQLDRWASPVRLDYSWLRWPAGLAVVGGCLIAGAVIGRSAWRAGTSPLALAESTSNRTTVVATSSVAAGDSANRTPSASTARGAVSEEKREPRPVYGDPDSQRGTTGAERAAVPGRTGAEPERLVLPAGGAVAIDPKAIQSGQVIAGPSGARPLVAIAPEGLSLDQEGLRFENIDFVWQPAALGANTAGPSAMIHLAASRMEFRGCSFQSSRPESALPLAIRWVGSARARNSEMGLPTGELRISDCVFRNVAMGVSCQTPGAVVLGVTNTLYVARGSMLQLVRWPRVDEPVVIRLAGTTLRESGALLESPGPAADQEPGRLAVVADGCVFAPAKGMALVCLLGTMPPEKVLKSIEWSGQGSLVMPEMPIACWQTPGGQTQLLDDSAISMAGLVRGAVEFAGPVTTGPGASSVVRWQAPLQSPNAPGVDPARLAEPRRSVPSPYRALN